MKLATFRTTFEDPANTDVGVVTGSPGWLLQRDDAGTWRIAVVTAAVHVQHAAARGG